MLGIPPSTYFDWIGRLTLAPSYVRPPGLLEPLREERIAVCAFALEHPTDGYRRLTWIMLDHNVAALTESSFYRILREAGLNRRWRRNALRELTKPRPSTHPDEQWHTDIMYLWVAGRWYFFVAVLDAYSRYIVHWELLLSMASTDVVAVAQQAIEQTPGATPRVVHDHGVQFMGRDFKALIKHFALQDITLRLRHPQSNGVYERFNGSTRREGIGDVELRDLYQAREVLRRWVDRCNHTRLHSALGYLPPVEYYRGDPAQRRAERRQKLAAALQARIAANQERLTQQAA